MVIAVSEIDVTLHTARRSCVDSQREGMDMGRGPGSYAGGDFPGGGLEAPGQGGTVRARTKL